VGRCHRLCDRRDGQSVAPSGPRTTVAEVTNRQRSQPQSGFREGGCRMRLTVLGGCGAWPDADQACSGFLVEHEGFNLLMDVGFATLPRLLGILGADSVHAVVITHGHPDHCADLNALLRARVFGGVATPPLPVYALPGALDAVLALDRPGMLADGYALYEFLAGDRLPVGPFMVNSRPLPHSVPNAGLRLTAGGTSLAYTGDTGPTEDIVDLAFGVDLLLHEATFIERTTLDDAYLSSATEAGQHAAAAGVARLLLTHLTPGTDQTAAQRSAAQAFDGPIDVARCGLVVELPERDNQ
jgi:ribonuclease BN (tRNA processing enzyme)